MQRPLFRQRRTSVSRISRRWRTDLRTWRYADNDEHGASQHSAFGYAHRALPVAPVPHTERPDCRIPRATTYRNYEPTPIRGTGGCRPKRSHATRRIETCRIWPTGMSSPRRLGRRNSPVRHEQLPAAPGQREHRSRQRFWRALEPGDGARRSGESPRRPNRR